MKVHFLTIVLDGMPWVSMHWPEFRKLEFDWHWWVVEGVAEPTGDTSWVARVLPRLSNDGTSELLNSICAADKRVTRLACEGWPGKISMCNEAMAKITDPSFLLWQIDADEVWTAEQLRLGRAMMMRAAHCNCAYFRCRYFVGPDLVITNRNGYGNRTEFEWRRLWRLEKGARFESHEPPAIAGFKEKPWAQGTTEALGLVFDHYALATEKQMKWKQEYYGSANNRETGKLYAGAVEGWRKLQRAKMPIDSLSDFLPWVGRGVKVERVRV